MTASTITQKQAEQQVQANIHAAAAELPATAKLEQQLTSSTYQVHNLDPEQYPNFVRSPA